MSRIISRAESWERAYQAFQNVNFSAFDYDVIKQSMIDYIKLYFPEDFNDYIESSEFIAILELFAYLGELLMYRLDMNAHENFISTAQRKQSILRLAKLISYNPTRNIPARGLVKITSISTTERVFDTNGNNLANNTIRWNDSGNSNWKEQFLLVMNRVLQQQFGSVSPSDRVQVNDVLFELYTWNNRQITNGVFPYTATVSGQSIPMELVPLGLNENGPYERRPEQNKEFSIVYGSDGLGDASDTTGFFAFTKQGILQNELTTFDGITPNQTFDLDVQNINDTDLWVNNVDTTTREIITTPDNQPQALLALQEGRYGEWREVDLTHAQNVIFNTNPNRNKYEVETLEDDQVRLIFGDGEFADIPAGVFEIWYRTSLNEDLVIPQSAVNNQSTSFTYLDSNNNPQTLTFTFSLINTLQNASPSETIEHIRNTAPATYYSQDRMVNGRDYNTFMLQDPSILKLRAVNRTYAGDSKYIAWHDPSGTYENVKLFGDDLLFYYKDGVNTIAINQPINGSQLVSNYIEPLLRSTDFYTYFSTEGVTQQNIRQYFTSTESTAISNGIDSISAAGTLSYNITVSGEIEWNWNNVSLPVDTTAPWMVTVTPETLSGNVIGWKIEYRTRHVVAESQTTNFWNTENADRVIDYDTLNSLSDRLVILKANEGYVPGSNNVGILSEDKMFTVLGLEVKDIETGIPNTHQLSIMPEDINKDGFVDFVNLSTFSDTNPSTKLMDYEYDFEWNDVISGSPVPPAVSVTLPRTYITGLGVDQELEVYAITGSTITKLQRGAGSPATGEWFEDTINVISNTITIDTGITTPDKIRVIMKDYVYFQREDENSEWIHIKGTDANKLLWAADQVTLPPDDSDRFKRYRGRDDLNFAWFHQATNFHLVDPAPTNIIDIFMITRGYYSQLRQWLNNETTISPEPPTPLQLRTDYGYLLGNKMISDTVVLHSGKFKLLFGQHARPELQAKFKVVRSPGSTVTDNQVKIRIVDAIREFFDVNVWEFGETFYFTELVTHIHNSVPVEIDSVVLVPTMSTNQFGDLFQVYAREDEILQPSISVSDIEIIPAINSLNIRQNI